MKSSRGRMLIAAGAFMMLLFSSAGSEGATEEKKTRVAAPVTIPYIGGDAARQQAVPSQDSDADSRDLENVPEVKGEPAPHVVRVPPISNANSYTPVLASVLSPPIPVRGTDGTVRLAYELRVSNAAGVEMAISGLNVLDPQNSDSVVASLSPDDVAASLFIPGCPEPSNVLGPAQSGLLWVNLTFPSIEAVPPVLDHLITVTTKTPQGLVAGKSMERVARAEVNLDAPIVIGPPVEGDRWIALDACCDSYHRFSAIPLNGEWYLAERFAIDWVRVDKNNRLVNGDPKKNKSYPQYGSKLLAVADGVVLKVLDGLREQIPGKPRKDITVETASGNYVMLDLGYGVTALYAHIRRGSVAVREGETVRRGQVIGLLGNSGNSDAPHLHFHLMAGRLALASDGLPYVIDSFMLKGRAVSSDDLISQLRNPAVPIEIQAVEDMGERRNLMPSNLSVIEFPSRPGDEKH